MFCPVCGNKIDQISPDKAITYCPFCGADISKKLGVTNTQTQMGSSNTTFAQQNTVMPSGNEPFTSRQPPPTNASPSANYSPPPYNAQYQPYYGQTRGMGMMAPRGPYASFGERFIAWAIDMFLLWLVTDFLITPLVTSMSALAPHLAALENFNVMFYEATEEELYAYMDSAAYMNDFDLITQLLEILIVINAAVCALYFFLITWFTKGKTIGKMVMKLKTVEKDTLENVTSPGRVFLDSLLKYFFVIPLDIIIGAIAGPKEEKQYRITQKLARLVVVKTTLLNQNPI